MLLACVQPSLVLCNQLTNAWSKIGAAGEIRAVMASMRLLEMRPDVYTWSSLVHAHAVARQTGRYITATATLLLLPQTRVAETLLRLCMCKINLCNEGCFYQSVLTRSIIAAVLIIVCMIQALGYLHPKELSDSSAALTV